MTTTLNYNVRESQRARNITLKVSPRKGLEVVVPVGFDYTLVPEILSSRRAWIDEQMCRIDLLPGRFDQDWPPQNLDLKATGECFELSYVEVQGDKLHLQRNTDQLKIALPEHASDENIAELLTGWLKRYAKGHYQPLANQLAETAGLSFEKLVVRGQKTRWGSYSSRGTLSLNFKLLFLPRELLQHVILHELSHTVHMNHSDEFWQLLHSLDSNTELHNQKLSEAWKYLPAWVE